uniref:Uncharacterized protein n=1 Tax=Anopheles atroparvus TaxID=41427 RepID=A0AAG5CYG5_ANOAO
MAEVVMNTLACWLLVCSVAVYPIAIEAQGRQDEGSSCTQIDFDQATLTSLSKCGYMQEFIAKPYHESDVFDPYRPAAAHYLSNRWQGLTCGETVQTYSFNTDTELRMAYNLIFTSGATLEVRVFDKDRLDTAGRPILVESWRRMTSTDGWGYFREQLNKTVKRAQIQIEANMNAGSDLAIEYLTIFNYEVDSEECSAIDEFQTTTEVPTTTTDPSTTTFPATTTTSTALTTTTEEITNPSTGVREELPTTTLEATTTTSEATTTTTTPSTTTTTTTAPTTTTVATTTESATTSASTTTASSTPDSTTVTTTTNAPRDDTSMMPTSFSTIQLTSTTVQAIDSSSQSTPATILSTPTAASLPGVVISSQWMWMTLAALFATLFLLAASAVFYLWFVNQHLDRVMLSLLEEISAQKQYEKLCIR